MSETFWKVGELAEQTSVSIRTLHYYDEIGLLSPSCRTNSGHRLYSPEDVERLQQIRSLRQLGVSLAEIREILSSRDFSPLRVLELHRQRLSDQIMLQEQLCGRIEGIAARLRSTESPSVAEFIQAIKETEMIEQFGHKYYTVEQREYLDKRATVVGVERIRQAEGEWSQLIADVRTEMQCGTDPTREQVRPLAQEWMALIEEFTGADRGITKSLGKMWSNEPSLHKMSGLDSEMMSYIGKAMAAVKESS